MLRFDIGVDEFDGWNAKRRVSSPGKEQMKHIDSWRMRHKNLIGYVVLPLLPIFAYLVDVAVLSGAISLWTNAIYWDLGLIKTSTPFNFYNFDYSRTVLSISILTAPAAIWHWYGCAAPEKFRYEGGLKSVAVSISAAIIVLAIPLLLLFLPLTLGDPPSRKELALYGIHRNPVLFTISIYWYLYLVFMAIGTALKHLSNYPRSKC